MFSKFSTGDDNIVVEMRIGPIKQYFEKIRVLFLYKKCSQILTQLQIIFDYNLKSKYIIQF